MFKPLKFIFKLIGILIGLSFLIPIIMVGMMYKDYKLPTSDYEEYSDFDFSTIFIEKIDEFLADDTKEGFELTIKDGEANKLIKDAIAKDNPNYGSTDDNIPKEERIYASTFGEGSGGFKGASVKFNDGFVRLELGVDAGFNNILFKTVVLIDFKLETIHEVLDGVPNTQYKFTIKNIKIGNLPILWMFDLFDWGLKTATGQSMDEMIKEQLEDFGDNYDLQTKSIWINSEDIIGLLGDENAESNAMITALISFVDEEELLELTTTTGESGISLQLGKARSTKNQYVLTNHINNDNDLNQMFQGQLTSLLLSALGNSDTINYNMSEQSFNQMLDYYLGNEMNITEEFEVGDEIYELKTNPIFGEFVNDKIHLTIILTLNKKDETDYFKTHFTLVAKPGIVNNDDLAFDISEIKIGDDLSLSNDKIEIILSLIGDNDFIQGNKLIVKGFLKEFQGSGVNVEDVSVSGKYLRFKLKPEGANAQILEDLQDAIDNALNNVLTDPDYDDVSDAYNNYLSDPSEENLDEIMDAINDLTPEQQAELFDLLYDDLSGIPGLDNLLP